MNIKSAFYFLVISFAACSGDPNSNSTTSKDNKDSLKIDTLLFSHCLDTIEFYKSRDTLFRVYSKGNWVIKLGKLNDIKYAFVVLYDSLLWHFQMENNKWELIDTVKYYSFPNYFEERDVNGDDYNDLLATSMIPSHGNLYPTVFIYDKSEKTFYYDSTFSITNLEYDKKRKIIKGEFWGSACTPTSKTLYKLVNGKPIWVEEYEYFPDCETAKNKLFRYINKNNSRDTIEIKGDNKKLDEIFDKQPWPYEE